jgi:hypothetical protein
MLIGAFAGGIAVIYTAYKVIMNENELWINVVKEKKKRIN